MKKIKFMGLSALATLSLLGGGCIVPNTIFDYYDVITGLILGITGQSLLPILGG